MGYTFAGVVGEYYSGNLFAWYFLWKNKISTTHHRNLKYDTGQEIRPRSTIPGEISQHEIPKFTMCEQWADWSRNWRDRILHRRSPSGAQGRKALRKENTGRHKWNQTKGNSQGPLNTWPLFHTIYQNTGSWLTVRGTTVTGTVLTAMEFCDFLCACYDVTPP